MSKHMPEGKAVALLPPVRRLCGLNGWSEGYRRRFLSNVGKDIFPAQKILTEAGH
jgi:hypothetical protein